MRKLSLGMLLLLFARPLPLSPSDGRTASAPPTITIFIDDQFNDTNWDAWVPATIGDQSMDGAELVLTPNAGGKSGAALYNTPIDSTLTMTIEFRYRSADGSGADGISFFLVDGSTTTFSPGDTGGSLGYSYNKTHPASNGLDGGWLGIGLDEYGNYGSTGDQHDGPFSTPTPAIGLRGSEGKSYPWITGMTEASMGSHSIDGGYRRIRITLGGSATNTLKVEWDYDDNGTYDYTPIDIDLDNYSTQVSTRPSSLKFGFSGGTGGATNKHSIDWFTLQTGTSVGPPLNYTEKDGPKVLNGTSLTVTDSDSTQLSGTTVTISSGYVSAQDELLFTDQNGISGSWNSAAGQLTLSGLSSIANYQTALRSVKYRNISDNPSTTTRTVSFVAIDDTSNSGTPFTMSVNITPLNDPPSKPGLCAPANGSGDQFSSVTFTWLPSTDPDGDAVTYDLYYCTNSDPINQCSPVQVASAARSGNVHYAGLGYGSVGLLLVLGAVLSMVASRRRALMALLIVAGAVALSLGCRRSPGEVVTYTANNLTPGATYYWTVVAKDGKGGQTQSDVWQFTTKP